MSDELRFDDRVAIVTGAGGGLGRAHAMQLAARGARVVVNDLGGSRDGLGDGDRGMAEAVAAEITEAGGVAVAHADSVALREGADALVGQALDAWGRVDIVVNNAGITGGGNFAEPESYQRVYATHLIGTVNVLRAVWPHFLGRDYGRVVNTTSGSVFGAAGSGDYAAAKGGVFAFSRNLAQDHANTNIKVNAIMPMAYTRMTAAIPHPPTVEWLEKWFAPEKVSPFVAYLCHESVPCTGETFTVGGGRAAHVVFAHTNGYFDVDASPESYRDHFDEVMADDDPLDTSGFAEFARYATLLPDPGPFRVTGPLSHLRAIDFSTGIPGAYSTKLLVDAGVDVIKVEPPGGDPLRTYSASGQEVPVEEGAPLFRYLSAGKRSVIGEPGDPHVQALLADADIVVESFGPGRFDVDGVRSRHPHLVILSISPFGAGGPLSDRVATDFIVQAESGTVLFRGKPSRDPVQAGGRLAEYVGGLYGAPAVVVAAARARRTGIGEHIDLSLAEAMAIAGSVFGDLANHCMGRPEAVGPSRSVETPSIERASDGFVGFNTNTATQFQNFLILIERTDLLDDPRFAGLAGRYGHLEEWQQIIDGYMPHHPVEETVDTAAALRIPVSPVYDGETVLTNEHVLARGVYLEGADGLPRPRRPYHLDGDPLPEPQPAPRLGEHDGTIEPRTRPAPSEPDADPTALPLAGLKVLDVTSWWVGAAATHFLALMGAEVIHVESITHPDGMRLTGGLFGRPDWWEWGHMFAAANTDKLDITIDVGTDVGRDLMVRLIEWADVLAENFAPRVMENWHLDHDEVLAINPNIVYLRMPGMGLAGPWRDRVAFAQTMEQMSGQAWITGFPDDIPLIPRGPADPTAGLHGAFAILAALTQRDRTGKGVAIEAPMIEAVLNVTAEPVLEFAATGHKMMRMGNRSPYAAPQGLYPCAGIEQWLAISVATDEQWDGLRGALGNPQWASDPSLATHGGRVAQHDLLDKQLAEWAATRGLDEAVDVLVAEGVPAAVGRDPRVLSRHPQFVARGFYEEVDHPSLGKYPSPGFPFRFASVDHWLHTAAPLFGEHNSDVLTRILGLSGDEVAALEEHEVIGDRPKGL